MMKTLLVLSLACIAGLAQADTKSQRIEIAITRAGFDPGTVKVPAKTPVTLVFTRKTDATCTKSIVVTVDDGKTIERELPLDNRWRSPRPSRNPERSSTPAACT
jgi:hypothetical protein